MIKIIIIFLPITLLTTFFFNIILILHLYDIQIIERYIEYASYELFTEMFTNARENHLIYCNVQEELLGLTSVFYEQVTCNRTIIYDFIKQLNWYELLIRYNYDLQKIQSFITQEYITYIEINERLYNTTLLKNTDIYFTIKTIRNNLQYHALIIVQNYSIEETFKEEVYVFLSKTIENLLKEINPWQYIKTMDYQQDHCMMLKIFLENKTIQFLHNYLEEVHDIIPNNYTQTNPYLDSIIKFTVIKIVIEGIFLFLFKHLTMQAIQKLCERIFLEKFDESIIEKYISNICDYILKEGHELPSYAILRKTALILIVKEMLNRYGTKNK